MRTRSLKLLHRGIILVIIPLLCQITFIILLLTMLGTGLQKHQTAMITSYELIQKSYKIFRSTSDHIAITTLSVNLGRGSDAEEIRSKLSKIKKDSFELADQIRNDPRQSKNSARLKSEVTALCEILEKAIPQSNDQAWDLKAQKSERGVISAAATSFLSTLSNIVQVEEGTQKLDAGAAEKSIYELKLLLALAILLPIVLAVPLAKYFSTSITNPLKHLTENGNRLAERSELLPVISDAVEFNHVDKLLHTVSSELKQAAASEQEVFENALDMICSLDCDEVFRATNPYVQQLIEYQPDEIINHHLSEFADGEELLHAVSGLRRTKESRSLTVFELKMRRKDSTNVYTRWSCIWSEEHTMFYCVVSNISEQKRAEQLRIDFSEAVSQDVRNPLMAMQSTLKAITENKYGEVSTEARKTLVKTSKNVDRLVLMANELLDFQKIKGGKMQIDPVLSDLSEIVGDAIDFVSVLAEPKQITMRASKQACLLYCDRQKILQTVVNLLTNAIKFSPPDSVIEITIVEESDSVDLSVIDAGPGIPPEFQQRIFEPFEQIHSAHAKVGTGLGLAICKLIAEAHGGKISAASRDIRADRNRSQSAEDRRQAHGGSVFTVTLPKQS